MPSKILYHVTLPENVESIKKSGLEAPGGCGRYREAGQPDPESVYLSKLPTKKKPQAANIPSWMLGRDVVYVKVRIDEDDMDKILADDDWMIVHFVEKGDMSWEDWDDMPLEDKDDLSEDYWEESLRSGFGVRYHGDIPASQIMGYIPAHVDCQGNVSFLSTKR